MGAYSFITTSTGKTADDAFRSAVDNARFEHGHGGYTGTIAEKHSFIMIDTTIADIRKGIVDRINAITKLRRQVHENAIDIDTALEDAGLYPHSPHTKANTMQRLSEEKKRLRRQRDELKDANDKLKKARAIASYLIENDDKRISDKWGDAGCIAGTKGTFVFFGYASS